MPTEAEIAAELLVKKQQLVEVRAAISRVLVGGQSYRIMDGGADRQLNRAKLEDLRKMETELVTDITRLECGGGIRVNYGFPA